MRWFLLVIPLLLVFAAAAVADPDAATETAIPSPPTEATPPRASEAAKKPQSPPTTDSTPEGKKSPVEIRKLAEEYYQQCLKDWDAATHMTKKEWQRTCRRIVDERAKFMAGQMGK